MDDTARRGHEPFRLLFVCTGNVCRSPFAQWHTRFLLDTWLGPHAARFGIASAGTGAVVGAGMHPLSREQLGTHRDHPGVAAFRARRLREADVAAADLVLTMDRRHRSRVLHDAPRARPRTFTLREFARLLSSAHAADPPALPVDPVERARALVPAALAARGASGPVPADDDAVSDPITGDEEAHVEATRTIDAAVRRILGVVAPASAPWAVPAPRSPRGSDPRLPRPVPPPLVPTPHIPAPRSGSPAPAGASVATPGPRVVVALTPRHHPA